MEAGEDENVEVDRMDLERGLLPSHNHNHAENDDDDEERVLYRASFLETEENFVKYHSAKWVLYSLVLVLAWGFGLLMLLYLPIRRYILRKDIRSRILYLTPNAIVYKVVRPVIFPCFGVLKKEKHVILPSVADVVIEQGYMESVFGVYSIRFENAGIRRPPSDDVQIHGVANARAFRKAVLTHLSNMRSEAFSRQVTRVEDIPNSSKHQPPPRMSPFMSIGYDSIPQPGELILLQKLEEVGSSVKRVQTLIEEQHPQMPEYVE